MKRISPADSRVSRLLPVLIGMTAAVLGVGYALKQSWLVIVFILLVNGLWWWGRRLRTNLVTHFAFALNLAAAAMGCGLGAALQSVWVRLLMLLGVVLALSAWDVALFGRRMQEEAQTRAVERLEQEHLKLLLGVMGVSLCVAILPFLFSLDLNFPVALGLGVLLVLAWSGAAGLLRKG
jgi:hypothetical protein